MDHSVLDEVMRKSVDYATELSHEYVTCEHLMNSLLSLPELQKLATDLEVDIGQVSQDINAFMLDEGYNGFTSQHGSKGAPKKTTSVERVIQRALAQVIFQGRDEVAAIDLFTSILSEDNCYAKYFCEINGFGRNEVVEQVDRKIRTTKSAELVEEYTTNLNTEAQNKRIDPLIGRETEVDDLVHILARRKKNNCVLVGEPGTGKTAIAEGLAKRIVDGEVPPLLRSKVVYSLSIGDLLAGTRYRGDFEERLKMVLDVLADNPDTILFIDEIHMIMGAGAGGNSSVDVANMIKPVLGKGRLLTIGATTPDEFANSFEKDTALMRRFARLDIEQTSVEDTKRIVQGLRKHYEDFHVVEYAEDLLDKLVDLTDRYVKNKFFPDKALDIVDAAGAKAKLAGNGTVELTDVIQVLAKVSKVSVDMIDIENAASGGELSRLMLALLKRISEEKKMPTILFDEIDSGVSGDVADKIGVLLHKMGNQSQLLVISHLPQVASKASAHYIVEKKEEKERTRTYVRLLSEDERIYEVARLMSGEDVTKAALETAKTLMN